MLTALSSGWRSRCVLRTLAESREACYRSYASKKPNFPPNARNRRRLEEGKRRLEILNAGDYIEPEVPRRKPSLHEQLFPEEAQRQDVEVQPTREIPRLPLDTVKPDQPALQTRDEESHVPEGSLRLQRIMESQGEQTAALVMRNASKNLVDDDFRRIIPKGKYVEGWTLEQGDIIKGGTFNKHIWGIIADTLYSHSGP